MQAWLQQLNQAAEDPSYSMCSCSQVKAITSQPVMTFVTFMANPPTEKDSVVAKFLGSLLEFPKPLLAAVKGNAIGVGTTMLLAL